MNVTGHWRPSCFGSDLDVLCRLTKPVREYSVDTLRRLWLQQTSRGGAAAGAAGGRGTPASLPEPLSPVVEGTKTAADVVLMDAATDGLISSQEKNLSVPRELWRLVDFIYRYGMDVEDLFSRPGDPEVCEYIRDCLDRGVDFDLESLLLDDSDADPSTNPDGSRDSLSGSRRASSATAASSPEQMVALGVRLDIDLLLQSEQRLRRQSEAASSPKAAGSPAAPQPLRRPPLPPRRGRDAAVHSMAATLQLFLGALAEPVVPAWLYVRCVQEGYLSLAAGRQVLRPLPRAHFNSFVYLVSFFKEVLASYVGATHFSPENLVS
ncbi:hypothetical protein HK405_000546 [Cladochytrium tenue]|nr:hypothetical protein HK405_000546 [Cladochytrium tenue]